MALIQLDVTSSPFEAGRAFGEVGAYEELRGEATFAIDPRLPQNQPITDLLLAPTDADHRVRCTADVRILRPRVGGSRILLLDVVNRGSPIAARFTSDDFLPPGTDAGSGSGWLFERGYTIVCCGWQHDVPRGDGRFGLTAPEAKQAGQPLSGRIMSVQQPPENAETLPIGSSSGATGLQHVAYPPLDLSAEDAVLLERDHSYGPDRVIPRAAWSFVDAGHIRADAGFGAGKTYVLVYTAVGAPLTGLGLAATRDIVSFLRFASPEAGNPCAGQLDYALAFGASQTGRFLRQLLYLGFCEDEAGRLAIDGVLPHIAGSRLIESNWRFGQPSYNAADSLSCTFPYLDADQTDPVAGRTDGLLRRARERGVLPKVMHVNSSCEYWASQAALVHTDLDGSTDAAIPANVRVYHFAGTQHGSAPVSLAPATTLAGQGENPANSIDYRPLLRAAIANLDAWVRTGTEPPPSRHPNRASGTLVTREAAAKQLSQLPGAGVPDHLPPFARLDMGPRAEEQRQASQLPPRFAEHLPELVAATDADGNELGGLRHPDVTVPLATYTGWNPHRGPDGTTSLLPLTGATVPFAPTAAARAESGDPRPAISERYPSREAFLDQVRTAANELVRQRYLLPEDVDLLVSRSGGRYDRFTATH